MPNDICLVGAFGAARPISNAAPGRGLFDFGGRADERSIGFEDHQFAGFRFALFVADFLRFLARGRVGKRFRIGYRLSAHLKSLADDHGFPCSGVDGKD